MKPPRSIFDPKFKYRDSANTDVAYTIRRYLRLQRMQQRKTTNVSTLPGKKATA